MIIAVSEAWLEKATGYFDEAEASSPAEDGEPKSRPHGGDHAGAKAKAWLEQGPRQSFKRDRGAFQFPNGMLRTKGRPHRSLGNLFLPALGNPSPPDGVCSYPLAQRCGDPEPESSRGSKFSLLMREGQFNRAKEHSRSSWQAIFGARQNRHPMRTERFFRVASSLAHLRHIAATKFRNLAGRNNGRKVVFVADFGPGAGAQTRTTWRATFRGPRITPVDGPKLRSERGLLAQKPAALHSQEVSFCDNAGGKYGGTFDGMAGSM